MAASRRLLAALRPLVVRRWVSASAGRRVGFAVQSEAEFEQKVLQSPTPVLVDFHAEWCAPCGRLLPVLEEVVEGSEGRVDLARVDVDHLTELALKFEVVAVPVVVGMRGGEERGRFVGLQDSQTIKEFVANLLQNQQKT